MAVQAEREKRAKRFGKNIRPKTKNPFTGKLVCAGCGKNYRRKITPSGIVWICSTFNTKGKSACASKQIPEETLLQVTAETMGLNIFSEKLFNMRVSSILVCNANTLTYRFYDGTEEVHTWKDRSRRQSWTEEMKAEVRKKALGRRNQYA